MVPGQLIHRGTNDSLRELEMGVELESCPCSSMATPVNGFPQLMASSMNVGREKLILSGRVEEVAT